MQFRNYPQLTTHTTHKLTTKTETKNMEAKPLTKVLHEKAKKLGVERIYLAFSGGNDEGYLNVRIEHELGYDYINGLEEEGRKEIHQLVDEIESWAFDAWAYSGAGDGNPYGDDITYDLKTNMVSTSEWWTEERHAPETHSPMEIE